MNKTILDVDIAAPLDVYRDVVRPEWIDNNGHMNMGYYLVVFDFATDGFFRWIGLDDAHRQLAAPGQHAQLSHCPISAGRSAAPNRCG